MGKPGKIFLLIALLFCVRRSKVYPVDFWQYPEMAEKHSIFAGCFPVQFTFADYLSITHPEFYVDYVLPVGLPFSVGVVTNPVNPDLFNIGARAGYHVNFDNERLDMYFIYAVYCIAETVQSAHYNGTQYSLEFGGRFGFRYLFGDYFCVNFETGWMFKNFHFGFCIKLN